MNLLMGKYCRPIRKRFVIFSMYSFIIVACLNCTEPLILKNMSYDKPGIFMFGKTPQRTFYADTTIGNIVEKWSAETSGSQTNSSIVIYNNAIFLYDLSGKIFGFDRITGKLIGYEKYGGSILTAPVINHLRIFFVVNESTEKYSTFNVYDFINGKILHSETFEGGVPNEMLKLNDGIVLLTDRGELIKFNFVGTKLWSTKTKTTALSSPAVSGDLIVFGNQSGGLYLVSDVDGTIKSKIEFPHAVTSGITTENSNVFFCDQVGIVYSFNVKNEKINWSFDTGAKILSTPVLDESKLYIGNLLGEIFALSKDDGQKIWQINTKEMINTTPLITKNILVQPDVNKKVLFIDVASGKIEKTITFDRRSTMNPVFYDGMLYLGCDRGILNAYKVEGEEK